MKIYIVMNIRVPSFFVEIKICFPHGIKVCKTISPLVNNLLIVVEKYTLQYVCTCSLSQLYFCTSTALTPRHQCWLLWLMGKKQTSDCRHFPCKKQIVIVIKTPVNCIMSLISQYCIVYILYTKSYLGKVFIDRVNAVSTQLVIYEAADRLYLCVTLYQC
jgi:hypothetical protein